jgi:hypothetical protein
MALLSLLVFPPFVRAQYPVPVAPLPPAATGSTLGANLRNAAAATQTQATVVRRAVDDWGRRAGSAAYGGGTFQQDLFNTQLQFQKLRDQFLWLAHLASQLGNPRANNAVAELDAGLNIIAELFVLLQNQAAAGTLDRATVKRTCRAFEDALREWERELRRNTSRLGLVW